jgi:hypothetical protein
MARRNRKTEWQLQRERVQEIAPKLDAVLHRLADLAYAEQEREGRDPDFAEPEWATLAMLLHDGLCTRPMPPEGIAR